MDWVAENANAQCVNFHRKQKHTHLKMHRHIQNHRRQTSAMIFSFNPFTVLGAIPFHFYFDCLLHILPERLLWCQHFI